MSVVNARVAMALGYAAREAEDRGSRQVDTVDLALGLLHDRGNGACRVLRALGVDPDILEASLRAEERPARKWPPGTAGYAQEVTDVLASAYDSVGAAGVGIDTDHILRGLVAIDLGPAGEWLRRRGITTNDITQVSLFGPPGGAGEFLWGDGWKQVKSNLEGLIPSLLSVVRSSWHRSDLVSLLLVTELSDAVAEPLKASVSEMEGYAADIEDRWLAGQQIIVGNNDGLFEGTFDAGTLLRRVCTVGGTLSGSVMPESFRDVSTP